MTGYGPESDESHGESRKLFKLLIHIAAATRRNHIHMNSWGATWMVVEIEKAREERLNL